MNRSGGYLEGYDAAAKAVTIYDRFGEPLQLRRVARAPALGRC